jgi:hypothetical protein
MKSKLLVTAISAFVALGTMLAIVVPGSSIAQAGSAKHKITTWSHVGPDVEGAAGGTFKCNSTTGVWKLSLTGIQVIESDGTTEWPSLSLSALIGPTPYTTSVSNLSIKQDMTDGLFEISFKSSAGGPDGGDTNLTNPTEDCATGDQIAIYGGDGNGFLLGTMS